MTITDRLDEIQARADKATDGPWAKWLEVYSDLASVATDCPNEPGLHSKTVADLAAPADAEFIAHARTDVPALVKALRLVLNRHSEHESVPGLCLWCEQPYPCSERRDVISALGVA